MTTHRQQGPPKVTIWTGATIDSQLVLDYDVVAFQARGSITSGGYTWSITLLPRSGETRQTPGDIRRVSALYKQLAANQVVSLGFEYRGGILLGLIDEITRTTTLAGPMAGVGLTITGTGIGKVLTRDTIIRATLNVDDYPVFKAGVDAALGADNPVLIDVPNVLGPETRDGTPTFIGASVQDAVDWILAHGPSMRLPLLAAATGGEGRPSDYFETSKSVTTWHDAKLWSETPSDYQGSLWGFLQSILDRDFYECWVDCMPPEGLEDFPTPHLIIRPKPFDEPDYEFAPVQEQTGLTWGDLRTFVTGEPHHEISIDEVVSERLGVSDRDAYAYFVVTSQQDLLANSEAQSRGLFYPLLDTYIAKKFGMAKFDARHELVGGDVTKRAEGDDSYVAEVSAEVVEARNRLFNWYRCNPFYENGSITVVGHDYYRPGDPVFLNWVELQYGDERGAYYYAPEVSWSWQHGAHYLTTITLTRGHNGAMMDAVKAMILEDAPASLPDHYVKAG